MKTQNSNKKIKPFYYEREDTCPLCKSVRSIEAFTTNNKPIRLSLSIDRDRDVSTLGISMLKCMSCGSEFFPKWIGKYPIPMMDNNYIDFMNGYKCCFKRAEST